MTREQAIDSLDNLIGMVEDNQGNDYDSALRTAIEALEQQEIVRCGQCEHYKPMSNHWGQCSVHSSPAEKYRTCQICDYCSWAERRTNE